MNNLLIAFLILLASIPIGYILKYITKEEIESGRKYFKIIWITSLVLAFILLFIPINSSKYKQVIIFTLLFIANVVFISWKK
ncbi:MAG: hypothetical protein QW727_02060 [Candidatus Pacearchaeota archaeon]